jgi:uncharacterized membrane protein
METKNEITLRPTFGAAFGHGWETMKNHFLVLLLLVFVMSIITAPTGFMGSMFNAEHMPWDKMDFDFHMFYPGWIALGILAVIFGIIVLAYSLLVVPVFKFGSDLMFVQAARNQRPDFETLIRGFKENYLHIILANLLVAALVMLGTIFLIIPGIIIGCRLVFVTYVVMDKKLDPIVAVEESWKLTRGHGWTVFFMAIVSFFIGLVGFIMCFVGILPAIMWIRSSFASLYEAVLIEKNGKVIAAEGVNPE